MVRFVLAIAALYVSLGFLQPPTTVPSTLLAQAGRSPREFTALLAAASVPSGLEIKEADAAYSGQAASSSADAAPRSPVSQLVSAFNAAHPDYRATLMNGVFVIRPVDGVAPFLDQPSAITSAVTVTGRMAAARRIFAALDPDLLGVVLNSLGHEGEDASIVLNGAGGRTVIDTLNQVVMQSPSAWLVTTRKEGNQSRIVSFGLIRKDGGSAVQPMRLPRK